MPAGYLPHFPTAPAIFTLRLLPTAFARTTACCFYLHLLHLLTSLATSASTHCTAPPPFLPHLCLPVARGWYSACNILFWHAWMNRVLDIPYWRGVCAGSLPLVVKTSFLPIPYHRLPTNTAIIGRARAPPRARTHARPSLLDVCCSLPFRPLCFCCSCQCAGWTWTQMPYPMSATLPSSSVCMPVFTMRSKVLLLQNVHALLPYISHTAFASVPRLYTYTTHTPASLVVLLPHFLPCHFLPHRHTFWRDGTTTAPCSFKTLFFGQLVGGQGWDRICHSKPLPSGSRQCETPAICVTTSTC